jgi:IstB-like ATP binding protein
LRVSSQRVVGLSLRRPLARRGRPSASSPDRPLVHELLFEVFSRRYEHCSTIFTSSLPFDEWTSVFGCKRLTGALLDRLTKLITVA